MHSFLTQLIMNALNRSQALMSDAWPVAFRLYLAAVTTIFPKVGALLGHVSIAVIAHLLAMLIMGMAHAPSEHITLA